MRALWSFVLLVAVGAAAYMGWLMNRSGASTAPVMSSRRGVSTVPAPPPGAPGGVQPTPGGGSGAPSAPPAARWRPGVCSQCGGTGTVACSVCGGDGKVERIEKIACEQCGGTGQYKSRLGKGETRCPFCNGKGFTEKTNVVTCTACGGTGKTPCPACAARPR